MHQRQPDPAVLDRFEDVARRIGNRPRDHQHDDDGDQARQAGEEAFADPVSFSQSQPSSRSAIGAVATKQPATKRSQP